MPTIPMKPYRKKLSLPGVFVNDFPHQSPPGAPDHECKDDGKPFTGEERITFDKLSSQVARCAGANM